MLASPTRHQGVANDRATPISCADYIRLRREAAGLSRRQVASRLFAIEIRRPHHDRRPRRLFASAHQALEMIEQLELPGARAKYRPIIDLLGGIFPLDPDVYHQLAEEPADRHPTICRACGCSANDCCTGSAGVCTIDMYDTCSRCDSAGRSLAA